VDAPHSVADGAVKQSMRVHLLVAQGLEQACWFSLIESDQDNPNDYRSWGGVAIWLVACNGAFGGSTNWTCTMTITRSRIVNGHYYAIAVYGDVWSWAVTPGSEVRLQVGSFAHASLDW
jgi:hypothetical protein